MDRSTGPGSLRAERSTGSGSLRVERSTGPGSLRTERSTGSGSLRMERSTGPESLRVERSMDQEVFGRNGPRVRKPSGGTVRRIIRSSDSMIRGEVSGVFFGTRCMGPASAHLAPLFYARGPAGHGIPPPRIAKARRDFSSMSVEVAPGPRFASGSGPRIQAPAG